MANTKQATKRARQAEKHRANNRWQVSRMYTAVKKVLKAIEDKNREEASKEYIEAVSFIDKMVSKGLVQKNKAARHKSRLNHHIKMLAA